MVFGCMNIWGYPMFGWQNYAGCNYAPFASSPFAYRQYATSYQTNAESYAAATLYYPWVYTSPYGGGLGYHKPETSYQKASELNMMMYNPNYTPHIDLNTNTNNGISAEEYEKMTQMTHNSANKAALSVRFSCLGSSLNNLINKIDQDLQAANLTPEQKTALEQLKTEVEEIKQKREELANNSENMEVTEALNIVKNLDSQYGLKSQKEAEIRRSIQCSSANGNAGGAGGAGGAEGTGGAGGAGGTGGAEGAGGAGGTGGAGSAGDPNDPNANISQQYNTVLRPAIDAVLAHPRLASVDPEAKEKIEQKQKELEQAMIDKKDPEEVQKIYDELNTLVQGVQAKLNSADEAWKTKVHNNANQMQKNADKFLSEYDEFIPKEKKERIKEIKKALQEAISQNKPTEEIERLYKELQVLVASTAGVVKQNYEESFNICSDIRTAAEGIDWSGDGEEKIKDSVRKINKNNVRSVFIIWDKTFKSQFDDTCLLDTIFSEFRGQDSVKGELCDIILKAVEDFAKDKGIYNRVSGYITNINAKKPFSRWMSYSSIYQAFNEIVRIVKSTDT